MKQVRDHFHIFKTKLIRFSQKILTFLLPNYTIIDPCVYQDEEIHENVTVVISRCDKCNKVSISWYRQPLDYRTKEILGIANKSDNENVSTKSHYFHNQTL